MHLFEGEMKFAALWSIFAVAEEEITCYECEFTEFSDGTTAGNEDCVYINANTPILKDTKFGESCGSMIGCRGYSLGWENVFRTRTG